MQANGLTRIAKKSNIWRFSSGIFYHNAVAENLVLRQFIAVLKQHTRMLIKENLPKE